MQIPLKQREFAQLKNKFLNKFWNKRIYKLKDYDPSIGWKIYTITKDTISKVKISCNTISVSGKFIHDIFYTQETKDGCTVKRLSVHLNKRVQDKIDLKEPKAGPSFWPD